MLSLHNGEYSTGSDWKMTKISTSPWTTKKLFFMLKQTIWKKNIAEILVFLKIGRAHSYHNIFCRFGRKPCFLLFTFWQFIFGMMLSFTSNATFYAVMLGLCGIGHLLNYKIATVIGKLQQIDIHLWQLYTCQNSFKRNKSASFGYCWI